MIAHPLIGVALILASGAALARDDGRWADSRDKAWFDSLRSSKGLCCSVADGMRLDDPEWEFDGQGYRVRLDGDWFDVPLAALVTGNNKVGYAVVWPFKSGGVTIIRCFMPGSGT